MSAKQRKKAAPGNKLTHHDSQSGLSDTASNPAPSSPRPADEHDASAVQPLPSSVLSTADSATTRPATVSSFIGKLYAIVSNPATQHIISWADHGQSFLVKDEYAFSLHIMRQHFRHSNFSSFVRQLNFYGFHKRSTPSAITQVSGTDHNTLAAYSRTRTHTVYSEHIICHVAPC